MEKRLLTQAEWARERGVSKAYVSKLVRTGRIVLVEGKIDPDDAAARMAAQQDPVKRAKKLVATAPLGLGVVIGFPADGADPDPETDAKQLPDQLLRARIKREQEEGRLKELERRRRENELVDAEEIREEQLRRATEEREALLSWPARVSALMAAELGIDRWRLSQVLRKYVRQHLAERSRA